MCDTNQAFKMLKAINLGVHDICSIYFLEKNIKWDRETTKL